MSTIELLLNDVDAVVAGFVNLAFVQLSPAVQSLWRMMLLLFIVFYGYRTLISGNFEARMLLDRIFKFVITLAVLTEWNTFSLLIYDLVTNLPSEIASPILSGAGQDSDNINSNITQFFDNGFKVGAQVIADASWAEISKILYGISIYLTTVLFGGYAAFLIVLGKLGTALLLAVAPFFILMFVWDISRDMFTGWLRTLLNYAFIPLFVYTLLALFGGIVDNRLAALSVAASTGSKEIVPVLSSYILATFAGFLLSLQIMNITSSVVGGISLSTLGWVERSTRAGGRVAKGATVGSARWVGNKVFSRNKGSAA